MSVIKIKSGEIKNRLFLKYAFEDKKENKTNNVTLSSDSPVHVDCQNAYINLIPHFILLCEQEEINEKIEDYRGAPGERFGEQLTLPRYGG